MTFGTLIYIHMKKRDICHVIFYDICYAENVTNDSIFLEFSNCTMKSIKFFPAFFMISHEAHTREGHALGGAS